MVSIRISDLQKVGQDHELQRCRIRRWIAFLSQLNGENSKVISNHVPLYTQTLTQTRARTHAHINTHTTHTYTHRCKYIVSNGDFAISAM